MWKRSETRPQRAASAESPPRRSSPWHAVSVASTAPCCAAALHRMETRFLSSDAPRLPLTDCSMPSACRCHYKHHEDRREKPRRASERGSFPGVDHVAHERRHHRGRRAADSAGINDWKG